MCKSKLKILRFLNLEIISMGQKTNPMDVSLLLMEWEEMLKEILITLNRINSHGEDQAVTRQMTNSIKMQSKTISKKWNHMELNHSFQIINSFRLIFWMA